MTVARQGATATLLHDGRVLIAGGSGDRSAELFDHATGGFSLTGRMTAERGGGAIAIRLTDGRVYIAGGGRGPDAFSAEIYWP